MQLAGQARPTSRLLLVHCRMKAFVIDATVHDVPVVAAAVEPFVRILGEAMRARHYHVHSEEYLAQTVAPIWTFRWPRVNVVAPRHRGSRDAEGGSQSQRVIAIWNHEVSDHRVDAAQIDRPAIRDQRLRLAIPRVAGKETARART